MKPGDSYFPPDIEEQASQWAVRLDGGCLSLADQRSLEAWLAQDPSHPACLEQYQRLCSDLDTALPELTQARAVAFSDPSSRRVWQWAWVAGLAAAAVAVLLWVLPTHQLRTVVAAAPALSLTTQTTERLTKVLSDGSRADLNERTNLVVEMLESSRRVRLSHGEALFSVAKDPARPFIVETPAGTVRVTGTVFNVRADDSSRLEVTVLQGKVQVQPHAPSEDPATAIPTRNPLSLIAGQQLSLKAANADVRVLPLTAMKAVMAWRQGPVVFDGIPLREALQLVTYFKGCRMTAGPEVENLRLGGRFSLDDIEEFLSALEKALPVRVVHREDGTLQIDAR